MSSAGATVRRDAEGNPVWTFRVTDALLQANRRIAFPKDVAAHLGCKPGGLTRVEVEDPTGCRKLKVCLEQGDPPRTVVLNIAESLRSLGASCEQSVDLVVTGPRRLVLRRSHAATRPEQAREPDDSATAADCSPLREATDPPAPWGARPTPLLPRWYLLSHGNEALPRKFTRAYPRVKRVSDLEHFWDHYDEPLRTNLFWTLRDMAARLLPPTGLRVLPPSLDVDELDRLPLTIRTRNCVHRGLTGGSLAAGTVGELMRLPNFGIASLLDLMCVLEASEQHSASLAQSPRSAATIETAEDSTNVDERSHWRLISDEALGSATVHLVAAAAREFRGATTFGDLLRLDLSDLVAAAAADADVDSVPLDTQVPTVADRAIELLDVCLAQMSETQQVVVRGRIVPAVPETLAVLGQSTGLSRERVRQLDKQARAALEAAAGPALGLLRLIAGQRLGEVTTVRDIDDIVVELLPQSDDQEGLDSLMVARRMLRSRLGYECRDGWCLSRAATDAAKELKDSARQLADDEGLLDLNEARAALTEHWHESLDDLIRWIGWPSISGHIALRATARARTKAALLKIGAPATKPELAAESGLTERQVGGALSSIATVARATKDRWGLREWIDDVYEGIPAEIVQRINEDGGSTRLNRLLEELPRLFEVSETSVWAYLNTPAFRVEHGWVSESRAPDFDVGRLESVIDGIDDNGDPCWTFEIAQRHLEGYSLHGVPPEIAVALGCNFGSKSSVSVRSPDGCQDISVIWRKTSMHGPEIGRLGPALKAIGATPDTTTVCLVIHDPSKVSFRTGLPTRVRATPLHAVNASAIVDQSDSATPHQFNGVRAGIRLSGRLTTATGSDLSSLLGDC